LSEVQDRRSGDRQVAGDNPLPDQSSSAKDERHDNASKSLCEWMGAVVEAVIAHFAVLGAGVGGWERPVELLVVLVVATSLSACRRSAPIPLLRDQSAYLASFGVSGLGARRISIWRPRAFLCKEAPAPGPCPAPCGRIDE